MAWYDRNKQVRLREAILVEPIGIVVQVKPRDSGIVNLFFIFPYIGRTSEWWHKLDYIQRNRIE